MTQTTGSFHVSKKTKFILAGALIVIICLFGSIRIVPTGRTGVRTRLGQVQEENIPAGLVFKIPFVDDIRYVDNRQQDYSYDTQIWGETGEQAEIFYEGITVSYRIEPTYSSWWVANVANYDEVIQSGGLLSSAVKNTSKQFTNIDSTNRAVVEPKITESLQQSFDEKYGEGKITIIKVTVGNINFQQSYNDAIAAKQEAQINYEAQQIENKKAREKAQADADVKRTNAQADADALLIQANAEAEANKIREASLTPNIIQYEIVTRWDGRLPIVSGEAKPIIDITGIVNGEESDTSTTAPDETDS